MDDHGVVPGSELDLAIERALEAANLRAEGATATAAFAMHDPEPSAVESGELDGADGD